MSELNVIDSYSDYNGDGRLYPGVFNVVETPGGFEVWDFSGWTGFETCEPFLVASFPTNTQNTYPALAKSMAVNTAMFLANQV